MHPTPRIARNYIHFESHLYDLAKRFISDYHGAYWEFMELSNKGKYAYPKSADDSCKVINADNYYQGEMSCEAAGMGLMLMCYSDFAIKMHQLGREDDCIWFSNLFHKLRDFALGHNESGAILRFID